jgi:hypothetical protein
MVWTVAPPLKIRLSSSPMKEAAGFPAVDLGTWAKHLGVQSDVGDLLSGVGGFVDRKLFLTISARIARWSKPSFGGLVGL